MLRFRRKRTRSGKVNLPDDVELLSYLDGEVAPERHAEIETLKEESWEIRLRLAELHRDIEAYTEDTSQLVPEEIPPFEEFWKGVPAEAALVQPARTDRGFPPKPRTAQERAQVPVFRRLGLLLHFPMPSASLTLALALLFVVVALFLIRITSAPPVSAQELLKRTITAEDQRVRIVTTPVVYQKLRVHRKSPVSGKEDAATWEIWNDASHGRFRQRVEDTSGAHFVRQAAGTSVDQANLSLQGSMSSEGGKARPGLLDKLKENVSEVNTLPPVLSEITEIYQANRMDQKKPLSPEAFEAWQNHAQKRTDEVAEVETADGSKAYLLTTTPSGPFILNDIVKGELVVRASDWHPVEQRLKVQGSGGIQDYQVTESKFQVLALNALDPGIFADFASIPSVTADVAVPEASSKESPDSADLLAAEIEAHYALHRVKACLGESIEVVSTSKGRIEVRGLAASVAQKEELAGELQKVPFVNMRVQTIEEAMKGGKSFTPRSSPGKTLVTGASPSEPTITVQPNKLPIQDQLKQYFAKAESGASANKNADVSFRIADLSTEAVSLSRIALSHAWALRRLAEAFGPSRTSHLRMQSNWLLEAMVRDHLHEIQTYLGRSQGLLGPILTSPAFSGGNVTSTSGKSAESLSPAAERNANWDRQALLLFRHIEQMDLLTNGLFAGAGSPANSPEQAVQDLLAIYSLMAGKCEGLEREIAKEFSSVPN